MVEKIGSKACKPNPALKILEPLVGEWQTTGFHPYFPDAELRGRVSFEWIEGGAFLLMRSEIDHPEFPDGIAIFGSDDQAGTHYSLYFDERGVSRKQNVTITKKQLMWWRDDPHFSQRYRMDIGKDKMISQGEMKREDGAWEPDLSLTYEKVDPQV
jgi:hypothetical protein